MDRNNSAMNLTNSAAQRPSQFCERFQDEEFFMTNFISTLVFIILNMLSCPAIILMNVLVIAVVKKRRRLQSNHNILLACLAITDLIVGTVTQPTFIAAEMFAIAGGSVAKYCNMKDNIASHFLSISILASLLHLVIISFERYAALKYALRYNNVVTRQRVALAVVLSWLLAGLVTILKTLIISSLRFLVICSLLAIMYCHIAVYLITRRHHKQIKTEQISGEDAATFVKEKKAWKTTRIIIGFLFLAFLPGLTFNIGRNYLHFQTRYILRLFVDFSLMLNSLCNPIIYCCRNKKILKAIIALVRGQNQN